MTDPEEQLRRLAEGRARAVEPYSSAHLGLGDPGDDDMADVVELSPRRWPTAVAASLLAIVAVGAAAVAIFGGPDGHRDRERADGAAVDVTTTLDVVDLSTSTSSTTSVVVGPSIPDVVGDTVDDAEAKFEEAGIEIQKETRYVEASDPRVGQVIEVNPGEGSASADPRVELVVARLAPSLLSTDPCARPAHLLGAFDADVLVDRVYPRFTEGRITEIEVCTGRGVRVVAEGLDFHRIEFVADVDADGLDEIVLSIDPSDPARRVLSLDDDELIEVESNITAAAPADPGPACAVAELDVAMAGDVDGDGVADLIAPRDGIACLIGSDTVVSLGDAAFEPGTWFLDDIDDDGVLEVFIGQTTRETIDVRPYSIAADGTVAPVAEEDCCVQTTPAAAAADPDVPGRWFSCLAEGFGREAELISGRFWIDADAGAVEWTVDVGTGASPDLVHRMSFEDPLATDAWIPGNGCRNNSGAWVTPVTIGFGDDGVATPASIEAFNLAVAHDDPARRVIRLREALGMSDRFADASGPYREDLPAGYFELNGLHDDSVASTRWSFVFADDGTTLVSVTRSWACQPERGHAEFSTELCV